MSRIEKVERRVVRVCRQCRGSGHRLISAGPVRYKKCSGYRGRVESPNPEERKT